MLVLSRKTGEQIHIGSDIAIVVLEVNPSRVRIGIAAPKQTPIHRQEVYERIAEERADPSHGRS